MTHSVRHTWHKNCIKSELWDVKWCKVLKIMLRSPSSLLSCSSDTHGVVLSLRLRSQSKCTPRLTEQLDVIQNRLCLTLGFPFRSKNRCSHIAIDLLLLQEVRWRCHGNQESVSDRITNNSRAVFFPSDPGIQSERRQREGREEEGQEKREKMWAASIDVLLPFGRSESTDQAEKERRKKRGEKREVKETAGRHIW